ncbi:ATP synthase subunit a [Clostridia bacterium]|nr:ATP synthase subunit a [Clostridia bacterium]
MSNFIPVLQSSSESGADIPFMIEGLFSYKLFGQTFWITTSHVCILIVMLILIGFAVAANITIRKAQEVPGTFQNIVELIVDTLENLIVGTMGKKGRVFVNYISTIFLFILISNVSGLFGLRPPTADYGTTLALGLITFFIIHTMQIRNHKPKEIWEELCSPLPPWLPIWVPISIIEELAVPVSLSLRLFANILSGVLIMALLYAVLTPVAIAWPSVLHGYFDLFMGAIQAYVFCILTMTYTKNAMGEHEEA